VKQYSPLSVVQFVVVPQQPVIYGLLGVLLIVLLPVQWLLMPLPSAVAATTSLVTQSVQNHQKTLNIEVDQADLAEVLRQIAQRGNLNLVLNQAVSGQVSVSLHHVTPEEAIQTICQISGLGYAKQAHNILLVAPLSATQILGLQRSHATVFPLKYANAGRIATLLQQGIFATNTGANAGSASGQASATQPQQGLAPVIQADFKNNQLLVMGTAEQVKLITDLLLQLDIQRQRRVYQLSYANSVQVAQQLNASIFNDGTGGTANTATNTTNTTVTPASITVVQEAITDGTGVNSVGQSNSNGGGGSSGGGSSSASTSSSATNGTNTDGITGGGSTNANAISGGGINATGSSVGSLPSGITIRSQTQTTGTFTVPNMGSVAIPDTRLNTVTVYTSPQQFSAVESLISLLDAQPAQVSIQASLVEVSASSLKNLGALFQYNPSGKWGFTLGSLAPGGLSQLLYNQTGGLQELLSVQLQALFQTGKAKSLANPTVVATHDSETVISIVDDILRGESFSTGNSQFFGQTAPLIGQAGIILDILPKIGANGTVTLRVRPSITSVYDKVISGTSTIQLVRSRDLVAQQVQVKDGQTLIIGGLIDNRTTMNQSRLPGLSELPILGAMFRSTSTSSNRSELLIMITPHILNKLHPTPIQRIDTDANTSAVATPAVALPINFPQQGE
jgi:general secretion pathway protein D